MVEAQGSGHTVLLVDDEESMREVLKRRLMASGHQVLTAGDGVEGVAVAKQRRPDIILLDAMLPKLSGLETMRELKRLEDTKGIPIIFVTANASKELQEEALRSGAVACLHKPFQSAELLKTIQGLAGA